VRKGQEEGKGAMFGVWRGGTCDPTPSHECVDRMVREKLYDVSAVGAMGSVTGEGVPNPGNLRQALASLP